MSQPSILITGCSSGIGLHSALALKKLGWRVFAGARQAKDVEKLAENGFESIQLDVDDSESIRHAVQQVLAATGGTLDALFNNAGLVVMGAIDDLTRDLNRKQFETNVFGPMELIRQILPVMRQQGHGRIIQNSSLLGIITMPYQGAYTASKFALEGFTRTLYQECRGTNIHVSLINPGPIISDLRKNAYAIYQKHLAKQTDSAHQEIYRKLETEYFNKKQSQYIQSHPDAVVKKLTHALTSKRPKLHYLVGWPAYLLVYLQKILPERLFYWILTKIKR